MEEKHDKEITNKLTSAVKVLAIDCTVWIKNLDGDGNGDGNSDSDSQNDKNKKSKKVGYQLRLLGAIWNPIKT